MTPIEFKNAIDNQQIFKVEGGMLLFFSKPGSLTTHSNETLPLSSTIARLQSIKLNEILAVSSHLAFALTEPNPRYAKYWQPGNYSCIIPLADKVSEEDLEKDYFLNIEPIDVESQDARVAALPLYNDGMDPFSIQLRVDITDATKPKVEWKHEMVASGITKIFLCTLMPRYSASQV